MKKAFTFIFLVFGFSCKNDDKPFDASGTFEAQEIIVSAEQTGKILALDIEEGQEVQANVVVGQIDVSNLNIQKQQIQASMQALNERLGDASPQIEVLQSQMAVQEANIKTLNQQLSNLNKEVARIQHLATAQVIPPKTLDDLLSQKAVLEKQISTAQEQANVVQQQINAARTNVKIQNRAILSEVNPTKKRIEVLDDQIARGQIKNPITGTVLSKYAMSGEFTGMGKPLYKIADLSTIILRAYITGNQLALIKLSQNVKVNTDDGKGDYKENTGTIIWISDKAEFTPKTIQTKEERANTVYAIKVKLKNDGSYKIGMYGEVLFN